LVVVILLDANCIMNVLGQTAVGRTPGPSLNCFGMFPARAYVYEYKVLLSPHDSAYGTKRR